MDVTIRYVQIEELAMTSNRNPRDMTREELEQELLALRSGLAVEAGAPFVPETGLNVFQSALLDIIPSPVYVKGRDERYIACNDSFADFMGYAKEDIVGKNAFDIAPYDLANTYRENDNTLFRDGGKSIFRSRLPYRGGEIRDVLFHKSVFYGDNEKIAGIIGIFYDVTEELAVQRKLEEEQARFKKLFENLQSSVLIVRYGPPDDEFHICTVNDAALRVGNLEYAGVVGKKPEEVYPFLGTDDLRRHMREVLRSGTNVTLPWVFCENDTVSGWRDISLFRISETELVIVCDDVTDRYQAQELLRKSEERYALAVLGANDGLWDWNLEEESVYFSPRWKEILGYEDRDIPNRTEGWKDLIHPDDVQMVWDAFINVARGRSQHLAVEYRIQHKDGGYRWVLTRGASVKNQQGRVVRFAGSMTDFTQRKELEAVLKTREAFYRNIFNSADVGIYRTSIENGLVLEANQRMADMLGYAKPSDMINKVVAVESIWAYPKERAEFHTTVDASGRFNALEVEVKTRDGHTRWHRYSGRVMKDQGYTEGVAIDITDQKMLTESLRRQTDLLSNVLSTVPHFIFWKDTQGAYQGANDAYARRLGGQRVGDIIGKNDYAFLDHETAAYFESIDKKVIAGGEPQLNIEETSRLPDGSVATVLTSKVPLRDATGNVIGVLGIFTDITERKLMEQELQEREEMFRIMGESAQDGIIMLDGDGVVEFWNNGAWNIFGYSPEEAVGNQMTSLIVPEEFHGSHEERYRRFSTTGTGPVIGTTTEQFARHKQGHTFPIELSVSAVKLRGEWHAIGVARDITERYQTVQELQYSSTHDVLTGLYNRAYFEKKSAELEGPCGVVVCDVDGLKLINDNLGHEIGDELLQAAAQVLQNSFRTHDIIARIGGDEFAVLLLATENQVLCTAAQRVEQAVAAYRKTENALPLYISVGCSFRLDNKRGLDEIFRDADQQMYARKNERKQRARADIADCIALKTRE